MEHSQGPRQLRSRVPRQQSGRLQEGSSHHWLSKTNFKIFARNAKAELYCQALVFLFLLSHPFSNTSLLLSTPPSHPSRRRNFHPADSLFPTAEKGGHSNDLNRLPHHSFQTLPRLFLKNTSFSQYEIN